MNFSRLAFCLPSFQPSRAGLNVTSRWPDTSKFHSPISPIAPRPKFMTPSWLHFKTDHGLRREENKVEFHEGRFLDEKLPFLHKKKAEHSFELSLSIYGPLTVYF